MGWHIVRPTDHDGWLAERMKGLGSSDAGTVMGVSPFSTPLKLWRLKLGMDPPVAESEAMRNGHYLEPAVAEFFAGATHSVIDRSTEGDWIAVSDEKPWLRVSPDRLFWPEGAKQTPENRLLLEIKSTSKFVDPENLPLYWYCQVQYQMGVLGIHMAVIAWISSSPRLNMDYAWVPFNPTFYKKLEEKLDHFWNENILKRIQPEPYNGDDIKILFPTSADGKNATATEADIENCRRYKELEKEIDSLNEELSQLGTEIKKSIGDAEFLMTTDPETGSKTTLAKFKSINEKVLDEEKLKEENPDVYTSYMLAVFDKKNFKENEPELFKKYCKSVKGSRRFSIN